MFLGKSNMISCCGRILLPGSQLPLFLIRLRHRIWAVKQEHSDLLIALLADIHCPVNTGARFFPIDLSGRDLNPQALASVTVFNREEIASQDYSDSMERIAMPRHSFAGSKTQSANHRGSVMKEDFVSHS
jgi:hypothetical protein